MCCNGKLCGEYSQWLGMPSDRITYGHMVADTYGLAQEASEVPSNMIEELRQKWKVTGTLFLYVGSLSPRKGVKQLLQTWKSFEEIHPNGATLMLVGDGELSGELKRLCGQKNLTQVRFIGSVAYDEIVKYYAAADVFIMPTLEDNWSLVVPEAMACGLPILCSKYNGCWPELVKLGENGWVFDPLDSRDILRVLAFCLENTEDLTSMGVNSQQIVKHYSPESAARSILHACQIALARKAKTATVAAQ
jgi:glycosyltransferase involved in cell wall biosynthesis